MQTEGKLELLQYNIDGFSNLGLQEAKFKIGLRELYILRILIQIINKYSDLKMDRFTTRGKVFTWVSYSLILNRLKGLNYTSRMLHADFLKLESSGYVDRYITSNRGSTKVYFHITDLTKGIFVFDIKQ